MMRVIPIDACVGEANDVAKALTRLHQRLRDAWHAVESIVEADAMPVDARRLVEMVGEVDDDGRALRDADQRTGRLSVEAVRGDLAPGNRTANQAGSEIERIAIAQRQYFARARSRNRVVASAAGMPRPLVRHECLEARDH